MKTFASFCVVGISQIKSHVSFDRRFALDSLINGSVLGIIITRGINIFGRIFYSRAKRVFDVFIFTERHLDIARLPSLE
jgi:hypothetical protein